MNASEPRARGAETSFWDRLLDRIHAAGIRPPADRWHVIRAEQFAKALGEKDLAACTAEDVGSYLEALGRRGNLAAWQYRQVIDSLEMLLGGVLELGWARDFDWGFWRDSARGLDPSHPTIARAATDQTPPDEKHPSASGEDEELLERVKTEIRRRAYSIRTEQVYLQWIRRFRASCGRRELRNAAQWKLKPSSSDSSCAQRYAEHARASAERSGVPVS